MLAPTSSAQPYARPEFLGAADALVASYSEWPAGRMQIAPYRVDVLAEERRRSEPRRGGLSAELRNLDRYLEEVRRAANGG